MFIVTLGALSYCVDFAHLKEIQHAPNYLGVATYEVPYGTTCTIKVGEAGTHPKDMETVLSKGEAKIHHTDKFERKTGRKVALKKALDLTEFSKTDRAVFWSAYMKKNKV